MAWLARTPIDFLNYTAFCLTKHLEKKAEYRQEEQNNLEKISTPRSYLDRRQVFD
jgi:hypothetical protein